MTVGRYKERPRPPVEVLAAEIPDYVESVVLTTKDGKQYAVAAGDCVVLDAVRGRIEALTAAEFTEKYEPA